ncbi:MAG: type II toxin-antitoxin system VapC family toxin [Solirubrobacteraceae bacterium]
MRLLLDTNVLLWRMHGTPTLSAKASKQVDAADELMVSVVSFVEIGIKAATGRLRMPVGLREHVLDSGARILGLSPEHGLGIAELPLHHRDPFDRLLISQARSEGLTIVTADRRFADYDVPVVLAVA